MVISNINHSARLDGKVATLQEKGFFIPSKYLDITTHIYRATPDIIAQRSFDDPVYEETFSSNLDGSRRWGRSGRRRCDWQGC